MEYEFAKKRLWFVQVAASKVASICHGYCADATATLLLLLLRMQFQLLTKWPFFVFATAVILMPTAAMVNTCRCWLSARASEILVMHS